MVFVLLAGLARSPWAGAELASTPPLLGAPARVVLGSRQQLNVQLRELPGEGPVRTALNVGAVARVLERVRGVSLRLRLPRRRSPQELVLLVHRLHGPVYLYRIALSGRTSLPIRTRPHSRVWLQIGNRTVKRTMGARHRRWLELTIPPGVDNVHVRVVDNAGLTTERDVAVRRPAYRRLALAARELSPGAGATVYELVAAVAEPAAGPVHFEVVGPSAEPTRVTVSAQQPVPGRWVAQWRPSASGKYRVIARLGSERRELALGVAFRAANSQPSSLATSAAPLPAGARPLRRSPVPTGTLPKPGPRRDRLSVAKRPSRWRVSFGLGAGLVHNLGATLVPQLVLSVDLVWRWQRAGALGLRLEGGVSWSSERVVAPAPLPSAEVATLWFPVRLGLFYRAPERWPLVPYGGLAFVLQGLRSTSRADYAETSAQSEWVPGIAAFAGGELALWRLLPYVEVSWAHVPVGTSLVRGQTGGIGVQLGLRLRL